MIDRRRPEYLLIFGSLLLLVLFSLSFIVSATPQGTSITFNSTETAPVSSAASMTTAGGTFTTLLLNTTSQTMRWKAYVGNVTGVLTLDDADGNTIYDWSTNSFTGEVFASRSNSVDWSNLECAQDSIISSEQTALNMTSDLVDSINKTFNESIHSAFYVGTKYFPASSCRAIATFVNDSRQAPSENADFQVVLLDDTSSLVFAALLEHALKGFDEGSYDFQMIVPESEVASTPHTYYFYTELG